LLPHDHLPAESGGIGAPASATSTSVTFTGQDSATWAHLIGQPTPAKPWGAQGDAWPVRFIDTEAVASGNVPVEETAEGRCHAVGHPPARTREDGH
jgi:hypothetical protein